MVFWSQIVLEEEYHLTYKTENAASWVGDKQVNPDTNKAKSQRLVVTINDIA